MTDVMKNELDEFTREVITDSASTIEKIYSKEGTTVADSINKSLTMVENANNELISQHKKYADMYINITLADYYLRELLAQIEELKENKYKMTPNINNDLENIIIKIRRIIFNLDVKEEYRKEELIWAEKKLSTD